jgi:hypothetical protein
MDPLMPAPRSCRVVICSAAATMLGSLCPWASLLGLASATGLQVGYGWFTLIAGSAILALQLEHNSLRRLGVVHRHRRRQR